MIRRISKVLRSKLKKSWVNKKFFRGRFIGKRIRLLIRRLLKFIKNNNGKIFIAVILIYSFFAFKFNELFHEVALSYAPVLLVLVSVMLTYLFQLIPKRFKLRARLRPISQFESKNKCDKKKQFKYYVIRISNPMSITLLLDDIFLTNGLFRKDYDAIYINSGEEKPMIENNCSSRNPYHQAVIKPGETMVVKFATDMDFQYAYIIDNYLKLHKVDIVGKDWVSEYRCDKRAMFTTNPKKEKMITNASWFKEEKPDK